MNSGPVTVGARLRRRLSLSDHLSTGWSGRPILIGLLAPFVMMMLSNAMVSVAVPTMRDVFRLQADVAAWLVTAYTLPYVIFMPLYGRLGDGLGKRRLLLIGIVIFISGTVIVLTAGNLVSLIVGRIIQGIGAASIDPLCLALISDLFPLQEWGKAMSIWSSGAPFSSMLGFVLGGFLVDYLGWAAIFGPVLLVGFVALVAVRWQVPAQPVEAPPGFLRSFDWNGTLLLAGAITVLVFFVSSQSITGRANLTDWRLALAGLALFAAFYGWERRHRAPLVALRIFTYPNFSRAGIGAALRMFTLSGFVFLVPLYLTDIRGLNASVIGVLVLLHAAGLLLTVRLGGLLAAWWGDEQLARFGPLVQAGTLLFLAQLPATAPLWLVIGGIVANGMGGGSYLVALTRFGLGHSPPAESGIAAGVFSMLRFTGVIFGPVIVGVMLQFGLDRAWPTLAAYQLVLGMVAAVAFLGSLTNWGLRE